MNEIFASSATIGVVISLLCYYLGVVLKKKFHSALINPLLIAILLTLAFLLVFRVEYTSYSASAKYLSWLLTPATVSLAIPLYVEIDRLKKNIKAILISIFIGCLTSMGSILVLSWLFHFTHEQYVTFLPKSITTAIGMSVAEELGGLVPVAVAAIIITGIAGNVMAEGLLKAIHVTDPVAKGLAIGTSSHAIGTSKAMEIGEVEGAMSSLSIVTAGIITVVGANLFAMFL
ncbi:MAG: LrgB family protein [Solobacterium sp.]|nr:LrgB family protein [Solobacterium sp.]